MKSAKNKHQRTVMTLLLCGVMAAAFLLQGCGLGTFLPTAADELPPQSSGEPSNGSSEQVEIENNKPVYYNHYTGLACEESVSTCRPLSVFIGNFDQKQQDGLSFADILIEAPTEDAQTGIWALTSDWAAATRLSSIAAAKEDLLPLSNAFGAISVLQGLYNATGTAVSPGFNCIDATVPGYSSYFSASNDGALSTSGTAMHTAATIYGYPLRTALPTLPFTFTSDKAPYRPAGHDVTAVSFSFATGAGVSFQYDAASSTYIRNQNGAPHTDSATNRTLSFSNVILLLSDVTYYHSANGSCFELNTERGGSGYCYTGGKVVSIDWHYADDGSLIMNTRDGTPLIVNRGKTYIGVLKITDSATIVAK